MITTNQTINNSLGWSQLDTGAGESSLKDAVSLGQTLTLGSGSGTGQVNTVWLGTGILGSGDIDILDLYGLSRTMFNQSLLVSFSGGSVKSILVSNVSTGTDEVLRLANTGANDLDGYSNGVGTSLLVYPGSSLILSNSGTGYTVDASNRYLRIVDSGNGSTYKVGITGVV
jgi:hypothetical protein